MVSVASAGMFFIPHLIELVVTAITIGYYLLETLSFLIFVKMSVCFPMSLPSLICLSLPGVVLLVKCQWSSWIHPRLFSYSPVSLGKHISIDDSVSSSDFSHELQTHTAGCNPGTSNATYPKQSSCPHCRRI